MDGISKDALRYLVDQQRMGFKDNWHNEMIGFMDWKSKEFYEDMYKLNNADEFLSYLYKKFKKNRSDYEYLYYNFEGQHKKDRESMFDDIQNEARERLEEHKLYENGEL